MHSCQSVTSYRTKPHVNCISFCHVPSTRICEWLPQIVHFSIFVHAHKNANEPATNLPQVRNCGRTPAAVVLSVIIVMAVATPLLGS